MIFLVSRGFKGSATASQVLIRYSLRLAYALTTGVLAIELASASGVILRKSSFVSHLILVVRGFLVVFGDVGLPLSERLLAVVFLAVSVTLTHLLDGSKRHHFHHLEFFFAVFLRRHATCFLLLKGLELGLELVVCALQVLDELVLRLHHDDLLVELVLQVVLGLTHFLLNVGS